MNYSSRVPDDERMPEAIRTLKNGRWVQCDGCDDYFIWDKIPDDYIITSKEFHGQPNLRPETVVNGWICPDCGHANRF